VAGLRIAVLGGGLAGIAAALDCAQAGARVTLVEVRPRLGGAAYSFERDGLRVDNGQHVFLRCCTAYRALLKRIGGERGVFLQPRLEIPVVSPGGRVTVLRRSGLPTPLHLAGALARYPHLTVGERLRTARAALALGRLDPGAPELDRRTLGDWLAAHGQGPRAVAALWDLIALPTLNLPASQASLALGAFVFRTGLLERADAGDIGFHRRPLSEIVGDPAQRALRAAGVEVKLGWRAERVRATGDGFEVRRSASPGPAAGDAVDGDERDPASGSAAGEGGDGLSAEAVIVALAHNRAATLIEQLDPDAAAGARGLASSPIVNLHVVYDRRVCELPFAAGVRTPVQYLFDRSEAGGVEDGRQYLAISLSGAERELGMRADTLRERYLPALAELFPRARPATVERFLVTREHAATFRAAPGTAALRPGPQTAMPGLVLAGSWTATGWPATLEGAVRSGHSAARVALNGLGMERSPPIVSGMGAATSTGEATGGNLGAP
jgi:hydroxysqualene dehydroxylase